MPTQRIALVAVGLVLVLALGWTLFRVAGVEELQPMPAPALSSSGSTVPVPAPRRESAARTSAPTQPESTDDTSTGDPFGRARGEIAVAPGLAFPAQFEVLAKSAEAAPRAQSFAGSDRLVTLDLAPGRWEIFARADGLASRPIGLELGGESPPPPFKLVLEAAGRVGGQALDPRGVGLAGLPVWLSQRGPNPARSVLADAEGRYSFEDVPLGAYTISFGSKDGPIAAVVPIEVLASEVREVPPQTMPELGEGEIRVIDRANQPLAGARVFGAGSRGGWIDGLTDSAGVLRARFLPEGTFFLNVSTPANQAGQGPLEVQVGRIGRAQIQVR